MKQLRITKIRKVRTPEYGTSSSAGIDFFVPEDLQRNLYIGPKSDILIPSGIKADIPDGYMLVFKNKSGIATSQGAMLCAGKKPKATQPVSSLIIGACVVDSDYQGEMHIHLINVGCQEVHIKPGMKIAQAVLVPVEHANIIEVLEEDLFSEVSERGEGAFGSTNK